MRAPKRPIHTVWTWARRQPSKVQAFLAVVSGMAALLMKEKTCAGKVSSFLRFDFCFGYACHFWVDFAVPNPMKKNVEDFEVEREKATEEQRVAGEDGGGQREDGEDGRGQREDGNEY
ncbi:hypothetical protein ACFX1R_026660 [Malus domestica]